jgi:hypothetical protein
VRTQTVLGAWEPVCTLGAAYDVVMRVGRKSLIGLSDDDRDYVLGRTAASV